MLINKKQRRPYIDKAENNITSIKSIGITLYSLMGVILAWLGIKE